MELKLERRVYLEEATIGDLYVDGDWQCYVLEDTCRELYHPDQNRWEWRADFKQFAKTAIPSGRYRIELKFSERRGILLPWLVDVPDFTAIQIHNGGLPDHTQGCLLPGKEWHPTGTRSAYLSGSKHYAFPRLLDKLLRLPDGEEAWMTISNAVPLAFDRD